MRAAALEVRELCCGFGARSIIANISFSLRSGERVALIGGNGSGKTTLLRTLLGLHQPSQGELLLDAQQPGDWRAWRQRIAYVPQKPSGGKFPLRVCELIASAGDVSSTAITAAAQQAGIETELQTPLARLSGGQLQRAWLARSFACISRGAGLLLADEPTAALDFSGRADITALLFSLPVSALIVTHDRALATQCDRTLEIAGGELRELAA